MLLSRMFAWLIDEFGLIGDVSLAIGIGVFEFDMVLLFLLTPVSCVVGIPDL